MGSRFAVIFFPYFYSQSASFTLYQYCSDISGSERKATGHDKQAYLGEASLFCLELLHTQTPLKFPLDRNLF